MIINTHNVVAGKRQQAATVHSPFGILLFHDSAMMDKMTVTLYGNNQGAINVLDSVAHVAEQEMDIDVARVPGLNAPISDALRQHLYSSRVAIFGISSGKNSGIEARLAMEALQRNAALSGNIFFVQDFPGSSGVQDPDHQNIGAQARLCSILDLPTNSPERVLYKSVHEVGFPDHWAEAMENIMKGADLRQEGKIEKRRHGTEQLEPVTGNDVVVYLSGFKDPAGEAQVLRQILTMDSAGKKPVIVQFRPHPGEVAFPELAPAIQARNALLDGQWEIASPNVTNAGGVTDSRLIGVSDVTVVHPGATCIFHAAALRKKMISLMALITEDNRKGSSYDYELTRRYTHAADSVSDVSAAIKSLLDDGSRESATLRTTQQKNALHFDPTQPPAFGRNVMRVVREMLR